MITTGRNLQLPFINKPGTIGSANEIWKQDDGGTMRRSTAEFTKKRRQPRKKRKKRICGAKTTTYFGQKKGDNLRCAKKWGELLLYIVAY